MQLGTRRGRRRPGAARRSGGTGSATSADVLVSDLRRLIEVSYLPLQGVVARLDGSASGWVLYLDSDSPAEDHYWAMLDVIRVLVLGVDAAVSAVHTAPLRLIQDRCGSGP